MTQNYQKSYKLLKHGKLLKVNAKVGAKNVEPVLVPLLVDTGSTYTILRINVVKRLGCDIKNPLRREKIITGKGALALQPVVNVPWFNCAGQVRKNFEVVAYNIPANLGVVGILGMDFLFQAVISIKDAEICFPIT